MAMVAKQIVEHEDGNCLAAVGLLSTLRTKSTSKHLFWCFSLSQIRDSCHYLEGPWKDPKKNIGFQLDEDIPIMVLPGSDWSLQVLARVPYL